MERTDLSVRDTTRKPGRLSAPTLPPEVRKFIDHHVTSRWDVPEGNCPECRRTLTPVAVFTVSEKVVWWMKCPVHREQDYGVPGG